MAAVWLDSSTYPSVRAAIMVDMTAAQLPDAVIALPIYTGVAEMAVKGLDPDWATHNTDPDSLAALTVAAIYWCASLLVPTLPFVKSETFGQRDYQYQADAITPDRLMGILRARASALVGLVVNGTLDTMPQWFTVAHGSRALNLTQPAVLPANSIILGVG